MLHGQSESEENNFLKKNNVTTENKSDKFDYEMMLTCGDLVSKNSNAIIWPDMCEKLQFVY